MKRFLRTAILPIALMALLLSACVAKTDATKSGGTYGTASRTGDTTDAVVTTAETQANGQTVAPGTSKSQFGGTGDVDAEDLFGNSKTSELSPTGSTTSGSKTATTTTVSSSQNGAATTKPSISGTSSAATTRVMDADGDGWIDGWFHP